MTIWNHLKTDWYIKKSEIKSLGINPDKDWGDIPYNELLDLAEHLDIFVSDFFH